jgi:hypothetical protein
MLKINLFRVIFELQKSKEAYVCIMKKTMSVTLLALSGIVLCCSLPVLAAIETVAPNDVRLPMGFNQSFQGRIILVNEHLIWSGLAAINNEYLEISDDNAIEYCETRRMRLPNRHDWEELRLALSPSGTYNPDLFTGMRGNWFWSVTIEPGHSEQIVHAVDGNLCTLIPYDGNPAYINKVRCVIDL